MSAPNAAFLSDTLADCAEPRWNAAEPRAYLTAERIHEISDRASAAGLPLRELLALCDLAESALRMRAGIDATVAHLRRTGPDVVAATAIEILEDARDGGTSL